MLAAAAVVAVVYLLGVTNAWWPTPDSALYQGLGRSLFRGEGYRFNGELHTTVTPGLPVILGALHAAFGEGFWAPNLLMALCGLGGLLLAWRTLIRRTDRRTAFAAVLATAGLYRYYDYSHLILTDAPFVLLFWLLAYCCARALEGGWAWLIAVALAAAATLVVRAPGLVILGPWAVAVALDRPGRAPLRRRLAVAATIAAAAAVVVVVLVWPGRLTGYAAASGKGFSVPTRLYYVLVGLTRLPDALTNTLLAQRSAWLTPVGVALLALAVTGGVALWRRGRRLAAVTCTLNVVGVCFFVGYRSVRARYMMALYPLILLLVFEGLFWCVGRLRRWKQRPDRPIVFLQAATVLTAGLIAVNAPRVLRHAVYFAYRGHTGRYHEVIEHGKYAELRPLAEFLRERFGSDATIAVRPDRVSMLHFLGSVRAVPFKKVCVWNPWSAAHAEEIYADLRARPGLRAIVFDRGEMDKRFVRRMRELLDGAGDLERIHSGKLCSVYQRSTPGPASGPASRRSP